MKQRTYEPDEGAGAALNDPPGRLAWTPRGC